MLREILGLRQDEPGVQRRWFHDDYFDLFVWQKADAVTAFELCYGNHASERALVWKDGAGFYHDGRDRAAGSPDALSDSIAARFRTAADSLPPTLRAVLDTRIAEYAAQPSNLMARRKRFRRADWQRRPESR